MSNDTRAVDEQIDALIEAEVERAMAPYRALGLPEHVLAEMESMLRLGLRTHPSAQAILRALARDPITVKSEEVDTRGLEGAQKKSGEDPA
jgi:hypothetical protein